jgi:predicted transcriptional regulator
MVNRGRIEIMADILGLCTKPQVKTRIMYHANITFKQFDLYATLLKSHNLLINEANGYRATEKGLQFVNAFGQLQSTLDGSNSRMSSANRLIEVRQKLKMSSSGP